MRRILLMSACAFWAVGCGNVTVNTTIDQGDTAGAGGDSEASGDSDMGGGDSFTPAPLALGETCALSDDACDTGLICHDEGSGPECHTTCDDTVWPATACGATQACAQAAMAGACVGALALDASCNLSEDLCGGTALCVDDGAGPACLPTCLEDTTCAMTEGCFDVSMFTGRIETTRICSALLFENDACVLDTSRCGDGLSCVDDGVGPVCLTSCDPDGDWSECSGDACVPTDYFFGGLMDAGGACVLHIDDEGTTACDPFWDICTTSALGGYDTACADLDGDEIFSCTQSCDPYAMGGDGCTGGDQCFGLRQINYNLDPSVSVCATPLAAGALCNPDASLCPYDTQCEGNLTINFRCRQTVGRDNGTCVGGTDNDMSCYMGDSSACSGGTCEPVCPTGLVPFRDEQDSYQATCITETICDLHSGETGGTACGTDMTCVSVVHYPENGDPAEVIRTCVEVNGPDGSSDAGEYCDRDRRCISGTACMEDIEEEGTCLELCDSYLNPGVTQKCNATTADAGSQCNGTTCCIDMSCFATDVAPDIVGVRLPDHSQCDIRAQTCDSTMTCLPQFNAWDRGDCVTAQGAHQPGEACDEDLGITDCVAGSICLDFDDDTASCIALCNPTTAGTTCDAGWPDGTATSCVDLAFLMGDSFPTAAAGMCLPLCQNTNDCGAGQTCLMTMGTVGQCVDHCTVEQADCAPNTACIPEPVEDLFDGIMPSTGTCDSRAWIGGMEACDYATEASDCASEMCIGSVGFPGNDGFCAEFNAGVITECIDETDCAAGQACYISPDGGSFCAFGEWRYTHDVNATACDIDEDCFSSEICVESAPGASPLLGYCMEFCDYDANTFPNRTTCNGGGTCYHAPYSTAGTQDGFCHYDGEFIPGAPWMNCDDDLGDGFPTGDEQCAAQIGSAVCHGLRDVDGYGGTHDPTIEPEGMCALRCLSGATGERGTCFGVVDACVPDSPSGSPGLCLGSFALDAAPCDLIEQTGCPAFQKCVPTDMTIAPGGYATECVEAGALGAGEACNRNGECDADTVCITDTQGDQSCRTMCDPLTPACENGSTCVDISRLWFTDAGEVGLCAPDDGCDLVAQQCGGDVTCELVGLGGSQSSENHAMQCVDKTGATRDLGDGCSDPWGPQASRQDACMPGLTCANRQGGNAIYDPVTYQPIRYCTEWCDPNTPTGNSACANESDPGPGFPYFRGDCIDVSNQYNAADGTYGICVMNRP